MPELSTCHQLRITALIRSGNGDTGRPRLREKWVVALPDRGHRHHGAVGMRSWALVSGSVAYSRHPAGFPLPRELLELDPVGDQGVGAQAALLVFLIGVEVPFEPLDVA